MKIDLENEELLELTEIVGMVYSELLLERHLISKGVKTVNSKELNEEGVFNTAGLLLKLNREAHNNGLCGCADDENIILQEKIYHKMFKRRIETNSWWKEQVLERGGFQIASLPSLTSDRSSSQGQSMIVVEQDTQQESYEEPKKKQRRKP